MVAERYTEYAAFCAYRVSDWIDVDLTLPAARKVAKRQTERSIRLPNCTETRIRWAASQAVYSARQCEHVLGGDEEHMAAVYAQRAAEYSLQAILHAARLAGRDVERVREHAVNEQQAWLQFADV
jgi:hypothetical protein